MSGIKVAFGRRARVLGHRPLPPHHDGLPRAEDERVVKENETYTTEFLPGFELPLKRLLEIADRAGK